MKELARLLEDFAAAQHDFEREHAAAYASDECHKAYDRQEKIRERLEDEFSEVTRTQAAKLAAAIREAV